MSHNAANAGVCPDKHFSKWKSRSTLAKLIAIGAILRRISAPGRMDMGVQAGPAAVGTIHTLVPTRRRQGVGRGGRAVGRAVARGICSACTATRRKPPGDEVF